MKFKALPGDENIVIARDLILRYGWNTTCYQLLNPGISRWADADRRILFGFVQRHRVRVVAGAPICSEDNLEEAVTEWEAQATDDRVTTCYFGAESRAYETTKARGGYTSVVLGAQPIWSPTSWRDSFEACPNCRAQRNRARNKGLVIEEWTSGEAERSPDIKRLLREWLSTRGLPPMHFLVEPDTLGDLAGRRIFVASIKATPVGFLVASPIPRRNGWLTEQFVRGRQAPNGTVESLVDTMVNAVGESGSEYVTMGIVPLSRHYASTDNPAWLNSVLAWARAHGRRFYNFDGLDSFKSKFHPDSWEPIYAISNEPKFSFRSLYAIAAAFSDGPPPLALLRAVFKAAWQEWRWIADVDER